MLSPVNYNITHLKITRFPSFAVVQFSHLDCFGLSLGAVWCTDVDFLSKVENWLAL